ncbi:MAG TPA: response regulator [Nitrososphaera sp.]|jgi:DNA-binding response OmpR family regulator|nr:response regulator [Nitrososphaera sp.]
MVAGNDLKQDMIQTAMNARKYRVMIVDDEPDITTIFKIGLENNQFIVTTFNDPLEALSRFKPGLYDLLILDIRMPGMNGFQLYQKIRSIDEKVKVCFLTAFEEARGEFKSSFPFLEEVKCYLKKPITVRDLVKHLVNLANTQI